LLWGCGVIALLGAVTGGVGVASLTNTLANDQDSFTLGTEGLVAINHLWQVFGAVRVAVRNAALAPDAALVSESLQQAEHAIQTVDRALEDYAKTVSGADELKALAALKQSYAQVEVFWNRMLSLERNGMRSEHIRILFDADNVQASRAVQDAMDQVSAQNEAYVKARFASNSATVQGAVTLMVVFILVAFGVSLGIALALTNSITQPIQLSVRHLEAMAAGDLTLRFDARALGRKDEVGRLTRSTDKLAQDLNASIGSVELASRLLRDSSAQLGTNMVETATVIEEINRGIGLVDDHSRTQSQTVVETTATTENLLMGITELDKVIVEQAANVNQSSASIEEMLANIRSVSKNVDQMNDAFTQLRAATDDGRAKIENVVETIANVANQSEKLQEANDVISSIASQTSLLSMNAAIEAAHAGEAGRGFAVVADEIRKLAELATVQSKEISTNIQSIGTFIQSGQVASTTANQAFATIYDLIQTLGTFNDQIRNSMEEQNVGSRQILEAVQQITSITSEVRDGSARMMEGGETIKAEMRRILTESEQVAQRASDLLLKTKEVTAAVGIAKDSSDNSIELGHELSRLVAQFKTTA